MCTDDPIVMTKEVVVIEGGRKLYNYMFEINDDSTPLATPQTQDELETNE